MPRLIIALLFLIGSLCLGWAQTMTGVGGFMGRVGVQFNLVSDFGAACNGVADDSPALVAAGIALAAIPSVQNFGGATLTIPPGSDCRLKSCGGAAYFQHVPNFTLIATGARITSTGGCQKWGVAAMVFNNGVTTTSKFNTANPGDTCVTMQNPGHEANFPVGQFVMVAGRGLQIFSFPPNYDVWEYAKVASTPPGQVCFTVPLAGFYPATGVVDLLGGNQGRCGGAYCGGPGTLSLMAPEWGGTFHVIGGTWDYDNEVNWTAQTVINDDVTFVSGFQNCWFPSLVQTVILNNNNYSCHVEIDKEIQSITMNGGAIDVLVFQSSSSTKVDLENGAVTGLGGTPPVIVCNNSQTGLFFGTSYGATPQTFTGNNCVIPSSAACCAGANSFDAIGAQFVYIGNGQFQQSPFDPTFNVPPRWWTLNAPMYMQLPTLANANNELIVGSSSLSGGVLTINTNLTGPNLPPPNVAPLQWFADPVRDWSCNNCTGSPFALENSMAPAQHKPLWTYTNRTYTCANNMANVPNSIDVNANSGKDAYVLQGAWQTLTINISQADTNPSDSAPLLRIIPGWTVVPATGITTFVTNLDVNLTIAGTRTLTATAVTGAQFGDSLAAPGAATWVGGNSSNNFGSITNGPAAQCPVINITFQAVR
jgi:hypothetical protein